MLLLELFGALIVILFIVGTVGVLQARIERHGFLVLAWRWLTGMPWHGRVLTNAGWRRKGTGDALTRTKHAPRFHYRPRLHRTAIRTGSVTVILAEAWGLTQDARATVWATVIAAVALTCWLAWRTWRRVHHRKHRRAWVEPLHATLAPIIGIPVENSAGSWLQVAADRKSATVTLPAGWHGSPALRDQLAGAVKSKLGMEEPDVSWQLTGPAHCVMFTETQPPPRTAGLADIEEAIARARPGELVIGPGKGGRIIIVSLDNNSPHVGASMGTGGGKSTLGRLLLAQHLHRGGIGLVIDAKLISHPWCWGLPNVAYADTPALMHDALVWLGGDQQRVVGELDRRNQVAKMSTDVEGMMHGNPGAPLMILAEELNLTLPRLRSHWRDWLGGDGKSPAVQALEDVAFAGRQVRIHLVMIGQMLSARATGSGEARENIGIRILARYSKRNWDMLAPEYPMPLSSDVNGRVQVVASGKVREAQAADLTLRECRQLAMSGTVTSLPAGMPGRTIMPVVGPTAEIPAGSGHQQQPVTLREACRTGLVPMSLAAVRTARHRDPNFPKETGMEGSAQVYDPAALADYARSRR